MPKKVRRREHPHSQGPHHERLQRHENYRDWRGTKRESKDIRRKGSSQPQIPGILAGPHGARDPLAFSKHDMGPSRPLSLTKRTAGHAAHAKEVDKARARAARASASEGSVLQRFQSRRPCWQDTSARSCFLHPLSRLEFLTEHLSKRAVLLRRGPLHQLPLEAVSAGKLLRGYSMGINAHEVSRQVLAKTKSKRKHGPKLGSRPLDVLAQGGAVHLDAVEHVRPSILQKDPFFTDLKKVAPGARGPSFKVHWAAQGASPQVQHETMHDQFIVQLYGVRRWILCPRGLAKVPSTGQEAKLDGCLPVTLRRGDLLYIPPQSWNWALPGPGLAAHLLLGALPLQVVDLLVAGGATQQLAGMKTTSLVGQVLPLWHQPRPEAPVPMAMQELCLRLPWETKPKALKHCGLQALQLALQRLYIGAGMSERHLVHAQLAARQAKRSFAEAQSTAGDTQKAPSIPPPPSPEYHRQRRRRELLFLTLMGPVLLVGLVICTWICCPTQKDHRNRRARRKARVAETESKEEALAKKQQ